MRNDASTKMATSMLLLKNHANTAEMRMCFLGQTDTLAPAAKTPRAAVAW